MRQSPGDELWIRIDDIRPKLPEGMCGPTKLCTNELNQSQKYCEDSRKPPTQCVSIGGNHELNNKRGCEEQKLGNSSKTWLRSIEFYADSVRIGVHTADPVETQINSTGQRRNYPNSKQKVAQVSPKR